MVMHTKLPWGLRILKEYVRRGFIMWIKQDLSGFFGKSGLCEPVYPSETVWKDIEHEYAKIFL